MQRDPDKVRRVVFLKLQRTGGTTLSASVLFPYCTRYGLNYMVPRHWFAAHPRVVQGNSFHMMFRHFPDFPRPWAKQWLRQVIGDYQTITILRDPVNRFISGFNHVSHYFGVKTFDQYLDAHYEVNQQSRWLGYDGRNADFLKRAFSGVGVTERFNESLLLFRRVIKLNLEDVLYTPVYSESPKVIRRSDLTENQIAEIRKIDWLDVELHRQATDLVANRVSKEPAMEEELVEFERALADFSHPLWEKRGPFQVGFSPDDVWYEFTGRHGTVNQLRDVPP